MYFIAAVFRYNLHIINSTMLKKRKKRKRNMEDTIEDKPIYTKGVQKRCRLSE